MGAIEGAGSPATLVPGEELVCVRSGPWRLLVPMRHAERAHAAALPALGPSATSPGAPVVAVGGELVPVVFAEALLGGADAHLAPEHQMLLLRDGARRGLLWVDAAEAIVEHVPVAPPPGAPLRGALVAGWSGADLPLAVLDVPALLSLLSPSPPPRLP